MILKALEMQGFKSFPEKTTLNFGKGITAVVGPNGSGKSNISDAVRWVLGEQSSKSLRGSKMEDVIFDGTKVRKAFGYAQVTLRLDNSDRSIAKVDEDEVAVTRRYFRSGESEYKINGENVRLRDVHELFMDTGLGRDGYSMVSQGKISDMISGKGSECREMLEEAAGISAYRYRRGDSLKKLSQAEDNLLRLRDILSELESRIGPLKTQSEKAEKFLVLSDERKTLEIGLWLYNIERLREELRKQDDKILIAQNQYDTIESELSEIEESIKKAFEESQNITVKIDEIRLQISDSEQQSAAFLQQCAVLQNSIEHNNSTIERIEKEKAVSLQNRKQLESEIASEEKLVDQIKKITAQKRLELTAVEEKNEKMRQSGGDLDSEEASLTEKITGLSKKLADSRVSRSTAQSTFDEITNRLESINLLLTQRGEALTSLEAQRNEAKKVLEKCEEEITSLTNSVNGLSMIFKKHSEKSDVLKKEIDDLSFETAHTKSKATMLEELEKNMEGYSGAVKAVMRESEKGNLRGIEGTVSKLITTESKYAAAIETALGAAVQNIICKTEGDAKRAIELLKRNSSGRATFQPISSVKGRTLKEDGLEDCDGFVGVASDLVETKEDYREIMVSLLGRVVVAEDLDYAIVIAKKYKYHFKIVTLDGQVINAGGSMTGGSQTKNAGILSRGLEIEKLKNKYNEMNASLEEKKASFEKTTASLLEEEKQLEEKREQLSNETEERIRLEGQKTLCDEQYFSAKNSIDELFAEKESCNRRIAEISVTLGETEALIERYGREIEKCEEGLSSLGERKDEIVKLANSISSEMSKLRLEIHDAEKDLSVRVSSMNLLKARLVQDENRTKELEDEIDSIKLQNESLKTQIESLHIKADELSKQAEELKKQISDLQANRGESENQNIKLRALEKEKQSQREQIGGEKARLEERRNSMNEDYDGTINKLYDEYQLTVREASETAEKTADPQGARKRLAEIKNKIRSLGSVNVGAIDEYKEVSERYEFMSAQLSDIEKSKRELTKLIDELTDKMSVQFREKFNQINGYFSETFKELFGGGNAEIVLIDPTNVLESEIEIRLQPPGKNVKRVDSLSGGEKGLSAISLLFAILKVNPAPFCIFDEVEAALDDINVSRYAQYVRRMTMNTQFILITHRRGTMEEADMLYGITMQEKGVSKLLELKTAELAGKLGITN